ncbi:unnamed protein product [Prunus armeniaca]
MPHDPSPPHHMPILPSTEQELVQHNDHAPDEPDISSTELSRLSNVPTHPTVTRSRLGVQKPNPKYAMNFIVDTKLLGPTCFSQAMKQEEWRQAMTHEFNALQRNGTWQLVPFRYNMNMLPNKWVFKIKRRADGSIERYKARLVANGFH